MSKEIYISSTPHETRLAIVESDELTEIYYERENEYTLAGSIYNGKVTRVLPGMQSSFVDIGLERDAFLYITDFMEEAGDSADFDHGEKPQRAPRVEGQNGRGERGGYERNGGERSPEPERGYVSERSQEQARSTPQTDVAQASEGRTEEFGGRGERNDRGGRGRGRGRRDRGGNADRPGQDRGGSRQAEGQVRPGFGEAAPAVLQEEEMEVAPLAVAEAIGAEPEIGEAAPGADGSRRWRGRRGRRRGRGTGTREEAPQAGGEVSAAPEGQTGAASDEFDEEPVFEIDGSAEVAVPLQVAAAVVEAPVQERGGRPGRDGRDGRSGRGERSSRGERPGSERNVPRAPRGFAPRGALYGVDAEPEVLETSETELAVEPLILPGESLGKYRKGAEPEVARATPTSLPDTAFKVDPNWDGGAMLPGETLSRYRGDASVAAPSASQGRGGERAELRRPDGRREGRNDGRREGRSSGRPEGGRGEGGRGRDADGRRGLSGQEDRGARAMMVPATVPVADVQAAGPVLGYAHVDERTEEIQAHRAEFVHAELPGATAEAMRPEVVSHAPIEQVDVRQAASVEAPATEEYEPEGASASYRIDPVPPREYRQSTPAAENEAEAPLVGGLAEGVATRTEDGFAGGALESVHAGEAVESAPAHGEARHGEEQGHAEGLASSHESADRSGSWSHEVTRLDAGGTMVSEPEVPEAEAPVEAAVAPEVEAEPDTMEFGDEEPEGQQGFAPGAGDLEEDFLDEEEFAGPTLHAHGGSEEFEDQEVEPLDGAADLGTMIRDMSLDQMTRTSSGIEEEEEDDFEEDTLEEEMEAYASAEEENEEESRGNRFASTEEEDGAGTKAGFEAWTDGTAEPSGNAGRGDVSPASDVERRGRRDGRRSGRGDRDRGRDRNGSGGSDRAASSDRSGSSDRGDRGDRGPGGSSERGGYDRGGLGERARNTGGGGDRERGRSGGRGRQSMQMTNLPAISELLKPGQEILCQIAKEPIAKKGARITSHIALPGRFLVFMPTVSHTGVSRKIESDAERRRLKEILLSEKGDAAGGFIVRTAADGASEEELRSDLRFLLNLWTDIKNRSESSKSPALIYHDLNLVERILRDQVTDNFSAIWVDTETEYERVLRFLQRFQPGLIRRVKLYTKETPLFEQFGITEEINKALRSKVWLKSGGSIVINQTEALVAIDINTGKYVGKTARLEDTIVKTNLDAIPEIVRQIRLRDLGGIIIIDFIDMDERKNRNRVMAALEDELKNDRAPSKVLPFNDFGLVAITRKRVKQSLERTLSTPCNVCVGTGMVKSPVTVCNDIYVEMRKMHKHLDRGDVMLRVHPEVVKQLKLTGSRWLQEMEEMCGKTILIKSDPALHPEQFDIH